MKRHFLGAATMAMLLSACATGYHSASNPILGLTGGYWDQPGPGRLIKVGFSGNGYITPDKVATYLLFRCAEVAQREGGSHFIFYTSLPDAIDDRRSSERKVNALGGKPATYAYILVVPGEEPDALSAADVISRLEPVVKPAPKQGGAS
ncbi:hypothetical protein LJR143_000567 [Pseudoxanthomonas sp. LjRoot143]|uniref:CC0125/CC1285 family lipoprotein n=1 Tax=Pseudoxanthomonas sp. LjRoot143 TaxID=3342266 RepID=UPI003ECD7156